MGSAHTPSVRTVLTWVAAAALVAALTGCAGTQPAPGAPVEPDGVAAQEAGAEPDIEGTEPTAGETVDWPSDWPAELPRVDGTVVNANSAVDSNPFNVELFVADDAIDNLAAELQARGFVITNDMSSGTGYMMTLEDASWQVDLNGGIYQESDGLYLRYNAMQKD